MTINVRISREDFHAGTVVLVFLKSKSEQKPKLYTKLFNKDDACIVPVYDTQDIILREEKA